MRLISLENLKVGMAVGQEIYDEHNRLLLGRGAKVKASYIGRLRQMGIPALYVSDKDTSDIVVPEVIAPAARARAVTNLTRTFNAVTKSSEGVRKLSLEEAYQQVRSKKFLDTFKSTTHGQGIEQVAGDVDTLIDQLMNREVLVGLNTIKTHDSYTFQHSIDVTIMGLLLGRKLGWGKERLKAFGIGCILHDVGKIFIEQAILTKPSRLSDEEYEIMKAHPTMGYELVRTIAPSLGYVVPHVAFEHHERQDGSGYPRGLKGTNTLGNHVPGTIHDFGAVAAVADIYDAMASDRPYRQGWPPDRVVALISELSGTHLNSEVVSIFLKTVAPYPIGTMVRVVSGRYVGCEGVVSDVDDTHIDRPKVRLLYNAAGKRAKALELDLNEEQDIQVESVRDGVPDVEPLGSSHPDPSTAGVMTA